MPVLSMLFETVDVNRFTVKETQTALSWPAVSNESRYTYIKDMVSDTEISVEQPLSGILRHRSRQTKLILPLRHLSPLRFIKRDRENPDFNFSILIYPANLFPET